MKKYIFLGVQEDLEQFFKRAQEKGFIEFISDGAPKAASFPDSVNNLIHAIQILKKEAAPQAKVTKDLNPQKLASSIVEIKKWHDELLETERMLQAEIARVSPLGHFSLEEIREIEQETGHHIQFFCVKSRTRKKIEEIEDFIHIASEYDMDYFMSISKKIESIPHMIEMHFEKSLESLEAEYAQTKESIKRCEDELKENRAYLTFLREHLTKAMNQHNLAFASSHTDSCMNDTLFAVEGWVPKNRLHSLFPLLDGLGVHAEEVAVEKEDVVPTCIENKGYGKNGEDLVHIYDTPSTEDRDPSPWVFWAFVIFFAMIISDAGYGLLYLATALFLRKRFPHVKAGVKRFLRLFTMIGAFCIGWGVLSGSYFGIELSPSNSLNRLSLMHYLAEKKADYHVKHRDAVFKEWVDAFPVLEGTDTGKAFLDGGVKSVDGREKYVILDDFKDSIFMEIALLMGIIHICLALIRHMRSSFAGVGWVIAIIGSYLYFPKVLGTTVLPVFLGLVSRPGSFILGGQLFLGGIIVALLLALIQNRLKGLIELTKPIELFADILSYLRLYALGLAGMILASTFNDMGRSMGFAAGFFVIILGHAINITVGIMGGTIHGLRLNFIEWYHHCFEGGGKLFNPLRLFK